MTVNERIQWVRRQLAENGLDARIITSSDPHMSEYAGKPGRTSPDFPAAPGPLWCPGI